MIRSIVATLLAVAMWCPTYQQKQQPDYILSCGVPKPVISVEQAIQKQENDEKNLLEAAKAAQPQVSYAGKYVLTAYCSCPLCCGGWSNNRRDGEAITASGTIAKAGRTIAADTAQLPFGTVLLINGVRYIVEDTGNFPNGTLDVYFGSHEEALAFGKQLADVYIIKGGITIDK